jgi:fatty-acyl-CoA synthase
MSLHVTAADWIAHHARYTPDREAIHDLASGRRLTYRAFHHRVDRAASFLRRGLRVDAGDRVAVLCHNDSDVFEVQFGCQRIGAVFVPVNWRLAVPEIETIVRDAAPGVLLHGEEFADVAVEVARRCGIPHCVEMSNGTPSEYESGLALAERPGDPPSLDITDTWTVMYTSGTTGRPKGTRITYRMALFNTLHAVTAVGLGPASTNLVFLPTFHAAGLNLYANPVFQLGGRNVVMRHFEPAHFLALLADPALHLTHLLGVPTNFLMMAQEPGFAEADFSHVVSIGIGGAAAPLALLETYAAKGIGLQQLWGMTETGPLGLVIPTNEARRKVGSSGLSMQYVELRICNERQVDVVPGETGELLIRGPAITPGYWNRPEVDAQAFTADGWFRTGDAARRDEEGFYFIVDRWKDMFISGGENVYPVEVENVIYQQEGVLETAVVAMPHEKWGEVGRAFIVAKQGAVLDADAILAHCRDHLGRYKIPKEIRFVDALPHNATGKILKHLLPRH